MKGRQIRYSVTELAFIEARCTMDRRQLLAAFAVEFGRDDVSLVNLNALCKRKGWLTGRTGCFAKGQTPQNKGLRRPGWAPGRMRETQFVKGERRGVAVKLYKPVGTERLSKEGYLERKIHDGLPLQSRWRAVHLVRWEEANGPVPKGMCLKFIDGDRRNTEPANMVCVPRAILPRLNGKYGRDYENAPAEVKSAILAVAKLEHAVNAASGLTPTQRMIAKRRVKVANG